MACAQAKFTGEVGVCTATSGPGAIHLLNGVYDALMVAGGAPGGMIWRAWRRNHGH